MNIHGRFASWPLLGLFLSLAIGSGLAQTPAPVPAAGAPPAPAAAAPSAPAAGSSADLTTQAWKALQGNDYPGAIAVTTKCTDTFKTQALEQQASLKAQAPKDQAFTYWALNDVGTCYFIQGQAYDKQGNKKGAIAAYKYLATNLSYAQCWDTKGWFWSPADAAKKRLTELQFDAVQ